MLYRYDTSSLLPYIDWSYYHHAWMVKGGTPEAEALQAEALEWLHAHDTAITVQALCQPFEAHSEGDDIIIYGGEGNSKTFPMRLPMLRQQQTGADGYTLSVADFIRPDNDTLHLFATAAHTADDSLMAQTLAVRLAEAAAEKLDHDLHHVVPGMSHSGLRPAVGYPCMPDLSINHLINQLLGFDAIGIRLTEHGAMLPQASVSGLLIDEPRARYFAIGPITEEQLADYARRRGLSADTLRPYLRHVIP